jgi:hypothetical protein
MKIQIKALHGKLSILEQNQDEILNTWIVYKNKEVNLVSLHWWHVYVPY